MTTISIKPSRATREYRCEEYAPEVCTRLIYPGERYVRSFGYAEPGDEPFELTHCEPCARKIAERDPSLTAAQRNQIRDALSDAPVERRIPPGHELIYWCPTCRRMVRDVGGRPAWDESAAWLCEECETPMEEVGVVPDRVSVRLRALERLLAWLDDFERRTKELPIQHEIPSRGCCTYNWYMAIIREARGALADLGTGGETTHA